MIRLRLNNGRYRYFDNAFDMMVFVASRMGIL